MQESVDVTEVITHLQQTIANQALELAKAQAMINKRDDVIEQQAAALRAYDEQAVAAVAAGNGGGFDVVGDRQS